MHPPHDNPPTEYFESLLARLRKGDTTAWPPLLVAIQYKLVDRAKAILKQGHLTGVEPDDVAHEVTLRLCRYRGTESAWVGNQVPTVREFWDIVGRIIKNYVIDLHRNRRIRKGGGEDFPSPSFEEIVGAELSGDLRAEANERDAVLNGLLAELDDEDRTLIHYHDYSDLTFVKIAHDFGWTVNTASYRYYAARRRLGELILDRGLSAGDLL